MIATGMRTTVTLDPDVERLVRDAMRELGISFKEALNSAARAGLLREKHHRSRKFVQRCFRMGDGQGFRWDKALAMAEAIEDEELGRKLSLRR
jgi:hypothetical protein